MLWYRCQINPQNASVQLSIFFAYLCLYVFSLIGTYRSKCSDSVLKPYHKSTRFDIIRNFQRNTLQSYNVNGAYFSLGHSEKSIRFKTRKKKKRKRIKYSSCASIHQIPFFIFMKRIAIALCLCSTLFFYPYVMFSVIKFLWIIFSNYLYWCDENMTIHWWWFSAIHWWFSISLSLSHFLFLFLSSSLDFIRTLLHRTIDVLPLMMLVLLFFIFVQQISRVTGKY